MTQLSEQHRQEVRDALRVMNNALRQLSRTASSARAEGQLSQASASYLDYLARSIAAGPLTLLTMGLMVDFQDSSPEVGKPVADDELPDINLVATDVPNN